MIRNIQTFLAVLILINTPALSAINSTLTDEDLHQAYSLFNSGEYDKAISRFESLAGDDRLAVEARIGLARVYLETGELEKAESALKAALDQSAQNPDALTYTGILLKKNGQYDAGRTHFEQVVNRVPDHLLARLQLGIMQWEWGEKTALRQTLDYFISYYRSHPNLTAEETALIAEACIYLDRVRDANTLFNEATQADKTLWQAYIPWGKLFLSKYNPGDARGVFEDALEINPSSAEAYLGLARCAREEDFEQTRVYLEQALNINPNLIEAHNLQAELDIVTGDYESALEKLEEPLKVNPNALSTRSLRAVSFYFLDKMNKFREEEQRILAVNPRYAALYTQIAELLSKRYLFAESVEQYQKALQLNPDDWQARAGLGTSLSRLGQEEQAKQELEKAFANDPFNKYVGNLLTLFDQFPEYKAHKSGNLIVRMHEQDNPVLAKYAVELAEESLATLKKKYDFDTGEQIILEIFPEHDDFAVRCFGIPGAQAFLGICFGNVVAMDSPRARTKGDFVWGETLWHEMVHVTHLRLSGNRIPRWLAEGIAVYETATARPYWSMNLDIPFILAFQNKRLLPLRELDSGFNRPKSPGQVTLSYFQASQVVEYIVTRYGQQKLNGMFPKFKQGLVTEEVIRQVFGKSIDDLDEEFKAYIGEKYHLNSIDYSYDPHEVPPHSEQLKQYLIEKLEENAHNPFLNYRFGLYYKKEGNTEKAMEYLKKAKEDFPLFVEKGNPYFALAELYLEAGQKEKAIQELTELTARNGKDLATLEMLADLTLETGDYDRAISALQKMVYISPFESDVHTKLARAYLTKNRIADAIAELEINLLTDPPDQAQAHCDLAEALLKAGQKSKAKQSALAALEIAPNYNRAQEILLETVE